jgi:hypothetical protein
MNVLLIPNTNSFRSYLELAKFLKKKKINYKLLVLHESVERLIIRNKIKTNIIKHIEPNYYKIYKKRFFFKFFLLLYYSLKFHLIAKIDLKKYNFDNIIVAGDRETSLKLSIIKIANQKKIQVYNYLTSITASKEMLKISRNNNPNFFIKKNSFTYKFFKKFTYPNNEDKRKTIIFYDKVHIYINYLLNILPNNPWIPSGGGSDIFLAETEIIKKLEMQKGCKKNIYVVGSVDQDNIKNSYKPKKNNKKKIAILLTHWHEHGLKNIAEHQHRNETLCEYLYKYNFNKRNEYYLYLHPKQKMNNYNWVKKYNIKIFHKPISVDFLNIDLIILSFSSSIVAWALEHKIKIIIANYFKEKHTIFRSNKISYANNLLKLNYILKKNLKKINMKKTKSYKKVRNEDKFSNKIYKILMFRGEI